MTLRRSSATTAAAAGAGESASVSSSGCRGRRSAVAATSSRCDHDAPRAPAAMAELIQRFDSAVEITVIAERLRARALEQELSTAQVIEILDRWGESLRGPEVDAIPGAPFLRLWLRRSTLEAIVERELGA